MSMISFENDYIQGAHPEVLKRLTETNLEPLSGYGTDPYCESAREKIPKRVRMSGGRDPFSGGRDPDECGRDRRHAERL